MHALLCRSLSRAYRASLRLYPSEFRGRFGLEMAQTLDDRCRAVARSQGIPGVIRFAGRIAVDHFVTAFTERFAVSSAAPQTVSDGVPTFSSFGDDTPRPFALTQGVLFAMVTFAAVSFLIGRGGARGVRLTGSRHPSPSHVLPVPTAAPPAELDAEVQMKPAPESAGMEYFRRLRLLWALDANHDGVLSAAEIANAPAVLRTLDRDGDGSLSPEECGLLNPLDARSMRMHPILEALDLDGDKIISPREIELAAKSLAALDSNHDGMLTDTEVFPHALRMRPIPEVSRPALRSN